MGKRAVVTILALGLVLGVLRAVLDLVLFWVVHALYSIVADLALLLMPAVLSLIVLTELGSINDIT